MGTRRYVSHSRGEGSTHGSGIQFFLSGVDPASVREDNLARAHRVLADDSVLPVEGAGIAHIAPAYGDLELGRKHDLPTLFSVDLTGRVMRELDQSGFGRQFFKDADPLVIRYLDRERVSVCRRANQSCLPVLLAVQYAAPPICEACLVCENKCS
jgi:tRNA synthetases class I (I, L, M and V)